MLIHPARGQAGSPNCPQHPKQTERHVSVHAIRRQCTRGLAKLCGRHEEAAASVNALGQTFELLQVRGPFDSDFGTPAAVATR